MKTLLIIAAFFCAYKILALLSAQRKEDERKAESERVRKEQESIRAEQARQREQIKAQIERAKIETHERIEAEKRRIEWQKHQEEVNRRAEAERVRLAKEVARHDDMLFEFGYRLEKAESEITHFSAELDTHNAQREAILKELADISERLRVFEMTSAVYSDNSGPVFSSDYGPNRNAIDFTEKYAKALDYRGQDKKKASSDVDKLKKRKDTLDGKLIVLDKRIFSTEQKIRKAEHDKEVAERKMAV